MLVSPVLSSQNLAQQETIKLALEDASSAAQEDNFLLAAYPLQIGMLLYPGFEALDLVGPHCFFSGMANTTVHLLWKTSSVVEGLDNFNVVPTTSFANCPKDLDVLFCPGGTTGTIALMSDEIVLDFLADQGSRARYVTSVCTGSLILGAAGLLQGYRATSHWLFRDVLPTLGAIPIEERVVIDRNRITGGGVTSGIDFGLVVVGQLRGSKAAETIQLSNEYDPPPAVSGRYAKPGGRGPYCCSSAEAGSCSLRSRNSGTIGKGSAAPRLMMEQVGPRSICRNGERWQHLRIRPSPGRLQPSTAA